MKCRHRYGEQSTNLIDSNKYKLSERWICHVQLRSVLVTTFIIQMITTRYRRCLQTIYRLMPLQSKVGLNTVDKICESCWRWIVTPRDTSSSCFTRISQICVITSRWYQWSRIKNVHHSLYSVWIHSLLMLRYVSKTSNVLCSVLFLIMSHKFCRQHALEYKDEAVFKKRKVKPGYKWCWCVSKIIIMSAWPVVIQVNLIIIFSSTQPRAT